MTSHEHGQILLCDFHPASGLGGTLRVILQGSTQKLDLRHESVEVQRSAFTGDDLAKLDRHFNPDIIFLVLSRECFQQAGALFNSIRRSHPPTPIIVVIDGGEPNELFELLKVGAVDFVTAPLKSIEILPRVWRLLEKTRGARVQPPRLPELQQLIGSSPAFLSELEKLPLLAKCEVAVLILGETGTGKELVAKAIHALSSRADRPFIAVNCGTIPVALAESELFGHVRGAFTSASQARTGLVHEAEGGTLFLDEVACLPLEAQSKLLRYLQEAEYSPLGSTKVHKSNVRIVAATNVDMEQAINSGKFRQDLYYRLNVIPIQLPPLRERPEDIPLLARHFLTKYVGQFHKSAEGFSLDALDALTSHDWPGNVRELEHTIQGAVVLCEESAVEITKLALRAMESTQFDHFRVAKAKVIARFEKSFLQKLLAAHAGNITRAAQAARKDCRVFRQLIRKHGIDVEIFKTPKPVGLG